MLNTYEKFLQYWRAFILKIFQDWFKLCTMNHNLYFVCKVFSVDLKVYLQIFNILQFRRMWTSVYFLKIDWILGKYFVSFTSLKEPLNWTSFCGISFKISLKSYPQPSNLPEKKTLYFLEVSQTNYNLSTYFLP